METTTFNGRTVYTLTQVGQSIQSVIEGTYKYPYYIKAEMVRLNRYVRTGHCYPELVEKDGAKVKAQMRGVIWSAQYAAINERFQKITGESLHDGITILCLATIEFSPQYGLALYIQDIEPSFTLGEMAKIRQQSIARLKQEGSFSANKQLALPLLPQRIAVISIETSKGYSDFMITLRDNTHGYKFVTELFPSLLQGEKAIATMIEQLALIEKRKQEFDCVAILRGGGGDVGLSCYDHYELAQRVATFPLPVLSGIGHSTNETVTEMVSFANKITPTEVAYFLIGQFEQFENELTEYQQLIKRCASAVVERERQSLNLLRHRMQLMTKQLLERENAEIRFVEEKLHLLFTSRLEYFKNKLIEYQYFIREYTASTMARERQNLDLLNERMHLTTKQLLEKKNVEVQFMEEKIHLLNPMNILRRGFSITRKGGVLVTDASQLSKGDEIETTLYEGVVKSTVE